MIYKCENISNPYKLQYSKILYSVNNITFSKTDMSLFFILLQSGFNVSISRNNHIIEYKINED